MYSTLGTLPNQAIPSRMKGVKFKEATMDALEQIALEQVSANSKFEDYYRMIDGKLSFRELSEVMPQFRELAGVRNNMQLDSIVRHYDLIGGIIRKMVSLYEVGGEELAVTNLDPTSANEYMDSKEKLITKYAQETIKRLIEEGLAARGINAEKIKSLPPEQQQQAAQEVEQIASELTPQSIEKAMQTDWSTVSAEWAKHTLIADREAFYMDGMDRDDLTSFLLTGRCFRHFHVGYDSYKIESWHATEVFFSQTKDAKHIEEGEYVGRLSFKTPQQTLTYLGHLMTKKQKQELIKGFSNPGSIGTASLDLNNMYGSNLTERRTVPFDGYDSYERLINLQNSLGIPLMESEDLEGNKFDSYLPELFSRASRSISTVNKFFNRNGLQVRQDLVQITEAYWVSYVLKGFVTYRNALGALEQAIVTDELMKEFIEEKKIKVVNKTLRELTESPEEGTIMWDYYPEVWKGYKISGYGRDPLYLDIRPLDFQVRGNSNLFDVLLPVAGILGQSIGAKLENYQTSYNIVNNQIYNYLEKELGAFFFLDVNFLDSSVLEGDAADQLIGMREQIADLGFATTNSRTVSLKDAFTPVNMSYSTQISDRLSLSKFYRAEAYRAVGLPADIDLQPSSVRQQGQKVSQDLYFAETDMYFEEFEEYRKRAYNLHINIAQFAQKSGRDLRVNYVTAADQKIFLRFTDEDFHTRQINISFLSSVKKRRDLQSFKNIILQTNTLGNDTLALAEVITSDSMAQVIEAARRARMKAQEAQQAIAKQEQDAELAKLKALKEIEDLKTENFNANKELDRANRLEIERIRGSSRVASRTKDTKDFYSPETNKARTEAMKHRDNNELAREKLELDRQKAEADTALRIEQLKVQIAALQNRKLDRNTKAYIARINKN